MRKSSQPRGTVDDRPRPVSRMRLASAKISLAITTPYPEQTPDPSRYLRFQPATVYFNTPVAGSGWPH